MTTLDRRVDAAPLEHLLSENADMRVLDVRPPPSSGPPNVAPTTSRSTKKK